MLPPSTAIADVLALRGQQGWLSPPLRPYATGGGSSGVMGTACTVVLQPGDGGFGPLYDLLSDDLTGQVLAIAAGDETVAVWGELLSSAARSAGASGVLVDGAIRDVRACQGLGLPLWARAQRTVGPAGRLEVAAVGAPAEIGGSVVRPGDQVVIDPEGVIVLPAAEADTVLADANTYAAGEDRVAEALQAGTSLRDAYKHKSDAVARITRT